MEIKWKDLPTKEEIWLMSLKAETGEEWAEICRLEKILADASMPYSGSTEFKL